jgi:hypothetical protein
MGWCKGTIVFDPVVKVVLKDKKMKEKRKKKIIKALIEALWNLDWDCESDSDFYEIALVKECFRELRPDFFIE